MLIRIQDGTAAVERVPPKKLELSRESALPRLDVPPPETHAAAWKDM